MQRLPEDTLRHHPAVVSGFYVNHHYVDSYIVSSVQNGASTVIPGHIQVAESKGFAAGDTVHWWAIKI